MNASAAFDIVLCLIVLAVAGGAVLGRDLFACVALYIVFGLLLTVGWVRLEAVDVALVEAAIGAGLTSVILLGAIPKSPARSAFPLKIQPLALVSCLALGASLCWIVIGLAEPTSGLRPAVEAQLARSGASNPVTAVLLNFRGYDTLLEIAVLLLALVGVWSSSRDDRWGGRPGPRQHVRPGGVLANFGRLIPPFGIVIGVYLVWVGTNAPGGAFQAATVLAAVWLLAMMAAITDPPRLASSPLRWLIAAGALLFILAGLFGLMEGAFLTYPPGAAKMIILTVELALTVSIAATLALLVLGPARHGS
ncbi:DUF4040 domain-containing protein [Ensifer sp. NBAIM29]|nr:DUF4040 domain-containing protein [Ensifer sp. NBAIM29]